MLANRRPIVDRVPRAVGSVLFCSAAWEGELGRGLVGEAAGAGLVSEPLMDGLRRLQGERAGFLSLGAAGPIPLAEHAIVATRLRARDLGVILRAGAASGALPPLDPYDMVRVDLSTTGDEEAAAVVEATAGTGCRPVAAGLLQEEHHARALSLGFPLLEGPFPRLPAVGAQVEISSLSTTILRLLALLADDDCPDGILVDALRADPGVSYKLLRLVNSTGDEGLRESLEFSVRVMGRSSLKRWLSILLVRAQESASPLKDELIFSSLVRARFGELVRAGPRTGLLRPLPDASGAFLLGLFSRLDELLGRPFAESLGSLKLHPDALQALVEGKGPAVGLLRVMKLAESGGWDELVPLLKAEGTEPEWLGDCWIEATHWAHEQTASP